MSDDPFFVPRTRRTSQASETVGDDDVNHRDVAVVDADAQPSLQNATTTQPQPAPAAQPHQPAATGSGAPVANPGPDEPNRTNPHTGLPNLLVNAWLEPDDTAEDRALEVNRQAQPAPAQAPASTISEPPDLLGATDQSGAEVRQHDPPPDVTEQPSTTPPPVRNPRPLVEISDEPPRPPQPDPVAVDESPQPIPQAAIAAETLGDNDARFWLTCHPVSACCGRQAISRIAS